MDDEDAVAVGGEHRDDEAQEVGEAVETVEIEIVSPRGKAGEAAISVGVEKQRHIELKATQTLGLYRGDESDRANQPHRTGGGEREGLATG